jgi:DNA-binding NarL/FixJ family response regulator
MTQLDLSFGPREDQVAALLATGATNSEIAHELDMPLRTVKAHCSRLYLRYGLTGKRHKRVRLVISMLCDQPTSTPIRMRPRLARVCNLVVLGFTNKQIGKRIGTSEAVIKNCLRMIYDVTGMFSRVELAIFWKSHKIPKGIDRPVLRANTPGDHEHRPWIAKAMRVDCQRSL